jgi:GDPmannose 4,6-dehydratase
MNRYYRNSFGIFGATAIFFNHESPRRTPEYVTRKITQSVARIVAKKQKKLVLGDMSAEIDWGYSKDYVEAAWQMLQQERPDDYVIATGETHSVKEFVDETFRLAGLDPAAYVETSADLLRPSKTSALRGDTSKARAAFGFSAKTRFKDLVRLMYEADLKRELGGG